MLQQPGLLLLGFLVMASASVMGKQAAVSAKQARSTASNGAASSWGPGDMLGLGSDGDLPAPTSSDSEPDMVEAAIPGEGSVEDEMVALQRPAPRSQQFLSSSAPKPIKPFAALSLAKAQSQGLMAGADLDSSSDDVDNTAIRVAQRGSFPSPPAVPKTKVLEEYDVDNTDDDDDEYRTTKMTEVKTREELERQQRGDVEHVKLEEPKKPKVLVRRPKPSLAAVVRQQSKVVHKAEVAEQDPGNDKMMGQCMAFAGWVKGQGSTGPDLIRIWKGTCMPSVMSGDAPPAYGNMCNALGTAVSKFAVAPWAPADLCQAVMAVFRESGVGATPLR